MTYDTGKLISVLVGLRQDAMPGRWPARTKHLAPHKPLLVLSVLDEYLANPHRPAIVEPTSQLEQRFNGYWTAIFGSSRKTTMALPFYHLKNDGLWRLVPWPGRENLIDEIDRIRKSTAALREFIQCAEIDPAFHQLVSDRRWTQHLRSVVITTHFVPEMHVNLLAPIA